MRSVARLLSPKSERVDSGVARSRIGRKAGATLARQEGHDKNSERREAVQEQHTVVRQHDLADRVAPRAADQARRRDRVMRCAPRPLAGELVDARAGDAADARDLDRLRPGESGQDRPYALREHRLAGPGWPAEQEVVAASSRDHQRPHGVVLPAHVAQVQPGVRAAPDSTGRSREQGICLAAAEHAHRAAQTRGDCDLEALDERRLTCSCRAQDQPAKRGLARRLGDRERSSAGADLAVERELAK
jgi:hypothetical protein